MMERPPTPNLGRVWVGDVEIFQMPSWKVVFNVYTSPHPLLEQRWGCPHTSACVHLPASFFNNILYMFVEIMPLNNL